MWYEVPPRKSVKKDILIFTVKKMKPKHRNRQFSETATEENRAVLQHSTQS
jgi:hypothetical protein